MRQADHTASKFEPVFHPASGYDSPDDVLNDSGLSKDEKRVILSSWASDRYVVESRPALREVPGIPHRLRLDDILAALQRLDDEDDPPPRGGLAMRASRCRWPEAAVSGQPLRLTGTHLPMRRYQSRPLPRSPNRSRWSGDSNVRRYRKLLATQLTDIERSFIERRLAQEMHG